MHVLSKHVVIFTCDILYKNTCFCNSRFYSHIIFTTFLFYFKAFLFHLTIFLFILNLHFRILNETFVERKKNIIESIWKMKFYFQIRKHAKHFKYQILHFAATRTYLLCESNTENKTEFLVTKKGN